VHGDLPELAESLARLARLQSVANAQAAYPLRTPYFCSGCPHNTSTRVPEGSRALAGIGCHYLALHMPRQTQTFSHMGGEGAAWIGLSPFVTRKHVFQNLGDGTYNHSGLLALRAAAAAGIDITYKILFNDAVAMTGGQAHEGNLTVPQISRQVAAEGARRIAIVSDEPDKYARDADFAPGVTIHHRDELDAVQRELREVRGLSVLIYDQTCAAEKRRRRKRGKLPDPPQRVFINDAVCEGFGDKRPKFTPEEKRKVMAAAAGMSQHEFETGFSRAVVTHRKKLPNVDAQLIIDEVMKAKIEVVKRSEVLEVMSGVDMSTVGGLENLKEWLTMRAACFSQDAIDFGIETPKGIALIGPPGTGKSLVGKATSSLLGLPLIKFDISRVFQSLVGQSEERVRAALKMLDAMAPCVVFLDEVDKAFQVGSGGDSGVSQRILGLILTHMQETPHPIFWVASANRVDNLPSEFLRRGRLDEVFSVSVPEADERLDIIKIHLKKRGKNPDDIDDLQAAVDKSNGYVPAELEAAVKDAIIEAYSKKVEITGELIGEQLANMKPLSEAFADQFNRMTEWADNNARPASKSKEKAQAAVRARTRPSTAAGVKTGGRAGMNLDAD